MLDAEMIDGKRVCHSVTVHARQKGMEGECRGNRFRMASRQEDTPVAGAGDRDAMAKAEATDALVRSGRIGSHARRALPKGTKTADSMATWQSASPSL